MPTAWFSETNLHPSNLILPPAPPTIAEPENENESTTPDGVINSPTPPASKTATIADVSVISVMIWFEDGIAGFVVVSPEYAAVSLIFPNIF